MSSVTIVSTMPKTYCGLPLHPIQPTTTPSPNIAFWNDEDETASCQKYTQDTHYVDFSKYTIRVVTTVYCDTVLDITNGEVICFIDINNATVLAFQSDEDLNMTLIKYPEIFIEPKFSI